MVLLLGQVCIGSKEMKLLLVNNMVSKTAHKLLPVLETAAYENSYARHEIVGD